ncbi:APC family permease [Mucilaginibacter sp. AW1-3]
MKKIRIIQLVALIFFTVSGGPYGLEPLLDSVGQHAALLLVVVTPLLWDVPAILTVLELNSMMPVNGGYYQWVKRALGPFWGFCEGWWTWLYTFVDLAIYPVLFVEYAGFFFPQLEHLLYVKIAVCLSIIWISAILNIWGILPVGKFTVALSAMVLTPFLIMFGLAFYHHTGGLQTPPPSLNGIKFPSLSFGLYTIMWNCFGWDSVTTYADEVEKPVRAYLVSIAIAFVLVIVVYFCVVLVSQQSHINPKQLTEEGYPALAALVGGKWLGTLIALGGMASALGLYAANLLSVSRLPKAMANDQLLHSSINKLHIKFQTPYVSILVCSAVVSIMILLGFKELIIIDVTIYGAGLFLEYAALIKLRIKFPDINRPFKVKLNTPGICLMILFPVSVYGIAITGIFSSTDKAWQPALVAVLALLSAPVVWLLVTWKKPHLKKHETIF